MTNRIGLLVLAAAGLLAGSWWLNNTAPSIPSVEPPQHAPRPLWRGPTTPAQPLLAATFTPDQMTAFVNQAMAAEAVEDPLLRCQNYPDPPGSHWSRATVEAYCRYRTQSSIDRDEAEQLIGSGRGRDLDRRLAEALAKQRSDPNSRSLLDHVYFGDFENGSAELRVSLDAWKKQSPRSAFAFAASGLAYLAAAEEARGTGWAAETPQGNFASMDKLLVSARADLATAMRLDPDVTPIYWAMLDIGSVQGDADYANQAVTAGLKSDPLNYALFAHRMQSAQPKWGGSPEAMQAIAAQAKAKSASNPLLELLLVEPDADAKDICGCGSDPVPLQPATYMSVLDRVARTDILAPAGSSAARNGFHELAVVYLSEALRFQPDNQPVRILRLAEFMEIDGLPRLAEPVARAQGAESDRVMAQKPVDLPTLNLLGRTYAGINSWDKASGIADHLIALHPEAVEGWGIRAMVQRGQSQPGLCETDGYILAHFANDADPDPLWYVLLARQDRETTLLRRQGRLISSPIGPGADCPDKNDQRTAAGDTHH